MDNRKAFGERIKTLRESCGLTIEYAAEKCDVSASTWRQYERGERLPSLPKLKRICLVLRRKPEYFFGFELNELLNDMSEVDKVKSKIEQLTPDDLAILDAAISKCIELRNE